MGEVVLGLNGIAVGIHDAGAALVIGNELVAAVEEERLSRLKRAEEQSPNRATREVIALAGIDPREIDTVAYGWSPHHLGIDASEAREKIRGFLRGLPGLAFRDDVRIKFVPHHEAHLWCGITFMPQGDARNEVDVLVLDGAGESTAGAYFCVRRGQAERVWTIALEASPGIYYEVLTRVVGFEWGEEGKTMGLASYACTAEVSNVPVLMDGRQTGNLPFMPDILDRYVEACRELHGQFVSQYSSQLTFVERAHIACSGQQEMTRRICQYVSDIAEPSPYTLLVGGTALNCTMNGVISELCKERGSTLFVPPPANDSGIAIGAAVACCESPISCYSRDGAYTGRSYRISDIWDQMRTKCRAIQAVSVEDIAAELIDNNRVIGWFDGRAEIGPRALGRRCIIARPDSTRLRDRINHVKGRESWRPLAPSVTGEEFARSLRGQPSPYMLIASYARDGAMGPLAGVIHVDGSTRPHVILQKDAYDELILTVGRLSGHEAVICTSFNRAGEPIVYTPEEALRSAVSMHLDMLAGEGWAIDLAATQ